MRAKKGEHMNDWLKKLLGVNAPEQSVTQWGFPVPWEQGRPSIYRFLLSFDIAPDAGLPTEAQTLPDDAVLRAGQGAGVGWAPGALDGVLGHHGAGSDASADELSEALALALRSPVIEHVRSFYDRIAGGDVLRQVDPLLKSLQQRRDLDPEQLHVFARWLATESPDRGAVKVAISLLGLLVPPQDTELLLRLGLHDEFTLYAAVALRRTLEEEESEDVLFALARCVDGWGRIQLVERLAHTSRADIKAWLLREGYKNSVMYEYLAHACATGGELLAALRADEIDDELLLGAGEILEALINGGPAEGIGQYDDGAQAVLCYLQHLAKQPPSSLRAFLSAHRLRAFVDDEDQHWEGLAALGWTVELRASVRALAAGLMADERWHTLALQGLRAADEQDFQQAASAAEALGLNAWSARFERQRARLSEQWFFLMRSATPAQADQVIELALQQLDLAAIATGAAQEVGLGREYRQHAALDFILQALTEFPGKGWPLIEAGLRSPVVRNRNMAVRALSAWGRADWPKPAEAALQAALAAEPDESLRERIGNLLAGEITR